MGGCMYEIARLQIDVNQVAVICYNKESKGLSVFIEQG